MLKVAILPEPMEDGGTAYRAVSGQRQSVGHTAGEALDALTPQLTDDSASTFVILQTRQPDAFFDANQQRRLGELMDQWRQARDRSQTLPPDLEQELDSLVQAELKASADRTASLLEELSR